MSRNDIITLIISLLLLLYIAAQAINISYPHNKPFAITLLCSLIFLIYIITKDCFNDTKNGK